MKFNSIFSIFRSSLAIIIAQLGTILLGLTDTIMVGQFGRQELAAVGLANQIFFVITVIGMGIMAALTSVVATSKGAENKKECGELLRSGIELGFVISIVIFLILIIVVKNFGILGQSPVINEIATNYLLILSVSVFPLMLFLALKHFSDGISFTRASVIATTIGVFINIFLNWVLIFGNLTFPALGEKGCAIATFITRIIMALILVVIIFYNKSSKSFLPPLISTYKTFPVIKKILQIGFPSGIQLFFEVGTYTATAVMAGLISEVALAAHQIAMGIIAFSYVFASGVSVSGSLKVAQALGKNNKEEIKLFSTSSIIVTISVMLLISIIFELTDQRLLSIFTTDSKVIEMVSTIFFLLILYQLLNGIQATSLGILRGIQDLSIPTIISLFCYWILGVPICLYFTFFVFGELEGIWIGMLTGLGTSVLFLTVRFFYLYKNEKFKTYIPTQLEQV